HEDYMKLVPIKQKEVEWKSGQRRRHDEYDLSEFENSRYGYVYDKVDEEKFKVHRVLVTGVPNE
ncbi:hypothetical protein, partial [Streptococcus pseudopneumoniae]|uniref:hypothetical protein n=1 Tax=Streptococcus pseudopneumoniae TaxID=257758 RepID=UPI0019D51543